MSLTLKVISYRGLPQSQDISAAFGRDGGVLGRSPECAFVLPDPEKFVSRKHARIEYVAGVYRLTDTSSAGTGVPSRNLQLQHDSLVLADGDRLKIGDYEIQVTISEDAASSEPSFPEIPAPFPAPGTPESSSLDDLFGLGRSPFDDLAGPPAAARRDEASGKTPSFIETPDVPLYQSSFTPPEPEPAPKPEALSDFNVEDLLAELERPASGVAVHATGSKQPEQGWEIPDDLFKGFEAISPIPTEGKEPSPPASPEPSQAQPKAPEVVAAMRDRAEVAAVHMPKPAPQRESRPVPRTDARESSVAESAAAPRPPSPHLREEMELFHLFLQGAGITDASFVKDEDVPKLMTTLGVLFRDLADGLMTVLRARTELKSQFRVAMTTMRPVNNNPLKFTANVEDAMKIMLARDHPGFVDPVVAVREGFSDLMNHQMAMTAGMQASLAELLKRFDPKRFEKAYEEGIVFRKKAKCWEAYGKAYGKLVEEAMENFFGDEFADAYEQQLRLLRPGNSRQG